MATFDDIKDQFPELVRKGLQGAFFYKRWDEADDEISTLKDATGLIALPTGYESAGILTKADGMSWTRDSDSADTEGWGYGEPVRRDVTKDVSGLQFTAIETRRSTLEMHEGLDLSAVKQDALGNVVFDKPDRPASIYYRGFALIKDGDGADAFYAAKWLPKFGVTDRGEVKWSENDEINYPVTITAYVDSAVGTSCRNLYAGPASVLTKMGFPVGP